MPARLRPYLLLAPALSLMAAVLLAALAVLVVYSLWRFTGGQIEEVWTLDTWRSFLGDGLSWRIIGRTMLLGAVTVVACALVGYPVAYALHRIRRPAWRWAAYLVIFSPLMTSVVVRTYGWSLVLGDSGFINGTLRDLGVIDDPIALLYQFPGVVIALVHILLPFMVFPILSVLSQLDDSLGEAAADLGAGRRTIFTRITLPLTMQGVLAGSQLVFALSISAFATPALLGGGRVEVLATQIYSDVGSLNWPLASVASWTLLALALLSVAAFSGLARRRMGAS